MGLVKLCLPESFFLFYKIPFLLASSTLRMARFLHLSLLLTCGKLRQRKQGGLTCGLG